MIVNNLHVRWTQRLIGPLKANTPLVVDADAVLALPVANQRLKTISRQSGKVSQRRGGFEAVELQASGTLKSGKGFDPFPGGEVSRPLVAVADNHSYKISGITRYVKRNSYSPFDPDFPKFILITADAEFSYRAAVSFLVSMLVSRRVTACPACCKIVLP